MNQASEPQDTTAGDMQAVNSKLVERRARRVWVGLIVGLLSLQLMGGVMAVYLAVGDPTVAVIPNYYQAGLQWDVTRENLTRFTDLGWQVEFTVQPLDREVNGRQVALQLTKQDHAVVKQDISAVVFHHAHGNERFDVKFDEAQPGQYVATCALTQSGVWEVHLKFEGDDGVAETRFTLLVLTDQVSTKIDRGDSGRPTQSGT